MAKTDKSGSGKWTGFNKAVKLGILAPSQAKSRRAKTGKYKPVEGVPF